MCREEVGLPSCWLTAQLASRQRAPPPSFSLTYRHFSEIHTRGISTAMVSHAHLGTTEPPWFWWTPSHQSLVQYREASETLYTRTSQLGVCQASVWLGVPCHSIPFGDPGARQRVVGGRPTQVSLQWSNRKSLASAVPRLKPATPAPGVPRRVQPSLHTQVFKDQLRRKRGDIVFSLCGCVWKLRLRLNQEVTWLHIKPQDQ